MFFIFALSFFSLQVARQLFDRYLAPEVAGKYVPGISIFDPKFAEQQALYEQEHPEAAAAAAVAAAGGVGSILATMATANTQPGGRRPSALSPEGTNAVGAFGPNVQEIRARIETAAKDYTEHQVIAYLALIINLVSSSLWFHESVTFPVMLLQERLVHRRHATGATTMRALVVDLEATRARSRSFSIGIVVIGA